MPNQKNSQLRILARKIAQREPVDERKWAREICNTKEYDQTYIRLRSQLKRRLLGLLFHLELRTGSELRKALYRSAKDVFCIRMLVLFGARSVAMGLVPKALERTRKYELTQDRIELLLLLRRNAKLNGYRTQFRQISHELSEAERLRAAEMRILAIDETIDVELVGKASTSAKARVLATSALPEATQIFSQFPTFNVGLYYFRIATLESESTDNSRKTFRLCDEAELLFSRHPHMHTPLYMGMFAIKRMTSAIGIRAFSSAHSAITVCEASFPRGHNNWFIWKQCQFLLFMHTKEWQAASVLHSEITHHERFDSMSEHIREQWALLGYYVQFALNKETASRLLLLKQFDKILTTVPVLKRDKEGYNASLLILQQLLFASTGDFDSMVRKAEGLKQYISRNLRNRHHTQLYAFLRTLIVLQKYDFDLAKVRKRARRHIEQFHSTGREAVNEAQTLPFDLMWEWISNWVVTRVQPNFPARLTASPNP